MKWFLPLLILFGSCTMNEPFAPAPASDTITSVADTEKPASTTVLPAGTSINAKDLSAEQLLTYAKSLIGVPYRYGSTDPSKGFDCSGFITYVFKHFGVKVPRSSVDFTNVGLEVPLEQAQGGDLILFTGTDSTIREVGHMGIITTPLNQPVEFIHSTSGKQYGVTITPLNNYYMGRFVKVIRVLNTKI